MSFRVKVWTGIGACAFAGGLAVATDAAPPSAPPTDGRFVIAAGEGGEKGAVKSGAMLESGATFNPIMAKNLLTFLRSGDHVLYFRHFDTGEDTPDYISASMGQCATQRQLNAKGAMQAIAVRDAFQTLKIPVSKVLSSPFCRAWQSADLAFGGHKVVDGLKLPKSPTKEFSQALEAQMAKTLAPLLAELPKSGTNTIIFAHDDNLPAVGAPYPETQGEALLFRPNGKGGFALVMQIKPDVWPLLAAQTKAVKP
jgi:hypothetical protein